MTATTVSELQTEAARPAPPADVPLGNPIMIGVPTFLVGSLALGLVLVGYVPATAVGASIPIIMTATGIGQLIAAVWASTRIDSAIFDLRVRP